MDIPFARTSPDRRTVLVAGPDAIDEAMLVAQAAGWELLVARPSAAGVELVLAR